MGVYVTQGTVHLKYTKEEWKVVVDPISDYKIKHRGKDYTVFVPKSLDPNDAGQSGHSTEPKNIHEARILSSEEELSIEELSIKDGDEIKDGDKSRLFGILKESAIHGLKVELEVEGPSDGEPSDGKWTIVGATVPAPVPTRP